MRESETAVAAEASCIALYEPLDNLLHIEFASGEADEGVRHLTLPMGQGILGEVAASGKAVLVEDAHRDPRFDSSVDRQTGFTTKSILATPIRRREELLGVLEVINKKGGPCFTEEDSLLLEVVANQAAVAIENAKLFERMVQSEQLSVIGRMAASIIHDLKQPMSVIRGFAELLGNPDMDPEKRRTFSDMILEDVDLFLGMTQELLDYSRGTMKLQPQEVQIVDWLESVLRPLREDLARSQVKVATDLNYRGPARLDPDRMPRVLTGIPQIKPTFLEIAPSGIPSNIIPHSKGVKCGLIRSKSPFSYSNHRPAKPKIPKPLVYAQVSPLGTSFATP